MITDPPELTVANPSTIYIFVVYNTNKICFKNSSVFQRIAQFSNYRECNNIKKYAVFI